MILFKLPSSWRIHGFGSLDKQYRATSDVQSLTAKKIHETKVKMEGEFLRAAENPIDTLNPEPVGFNIWLVLQRKLLTSVRSPPV